MGTETEIIGFIYLALAVLLIVLVVLWICLPFILLATNRRLDTLIAQNRRLLMTVEARKQPAKERDRGEPFL